MCIEIIYVYFYIPDMEMEAQRDTECCLKSHSQWNLWVSVESVWLLNILPSAMA